MAEQVENFSEETRPGAPDAAAPDGGREAAVPEARSSARPAAPGRVRSWLARLRHDQGVGDALFAFLLTRALVFALFVLTAQLQFHPQDSPDKTTLNADLNLSRTAVARIIRQRVTEGDANHYMGIAWGGYERRPFTAERAANWAFFPLYPLTVRPLYLLTGETHLAGVALSNLFLFLALVLLHRMAREFGLSGDDAGRSVFYAAAFPVSYFYSVPLPESLFLLLTVGSFYAAKRGRWLAAGLLGALASATRMTGVLLLPALALLYWETYRSFRPRADFLPLLLVPAGLLSYMTFLYAATGNPLAFKDIMAAWGRRPGPFWGPLLDYAREPLLLGTGWDFRAVNFFAAVLAIACAAALFKRRRPALAFYTLASILIPLSSGMLQSHARYAMVVFPVYFVVASAARRPRLDFALRAASLVLLTLMTLLYCFRVDMALS